MLEKLKRMFFGEEEFVEQPPIDEPIDISGIDPNDVLLLSDPVAIDEYRKEERLEELKNDIKYSVMRGKPWEKDELEYVAEIRRLMKEGIIETKGSYWWTSPHPTVYRAKKRGYIRIRGKAHKFKKRDEITFQCRMEREAKNLEVVLLIGRFSPTDKTMLCKEMSTTMKGM